MEYGRELAKGSLVTHRQTQHGVAKGGLGSEGGKADVRDRGDDPKIYRMSFPTREGPRPYPVKECSGRVTTKTAIRMNF